MRILLISLLVVLTSLLLPGCNSSSKNVSSGFPGDSTAGPSINLSATSGTLSFGGTTLISAAVRDAAGAPVSAAFLTSQVIFSSSLGGSFSTPPVVTNGLVTVKYTAPTAQTLKGDLPVNEEITVMYAGAIARVTIMLFRLY